MVTNSIAMCRIEMKRCRFGVQNGVLGSWETQKGKKLHVLLKLALVYGEDRTHE